MQSEQTKSKQELLRLEQKEARTLANVFGTCLLCFFLILFLPFP